MSSKVIKFFKKYFIFKDEYTKWKLEQFEHTNILFAVMFTLFHALYISNDLSYLMHHDLIEYLILTLLLRFGPIFTLAISYTFKKYKRMSQITFTHISNVCVVLVSLFTAILKIYIPKMGNPFGALLIDCIITILSTMFISLPFSIFNYITCILIVVIFGNIIPGAKDFIFSVLATLIPLGAALCVLVFSIDKTFHIMHKYILKVKQMSLEDNLTGLYNRNILKDNVFDKKTEKLLFNGSVLMLDIDHFKKVNDEYGHQTGDVVLCRLAAMLRTNIRKEDYIVRFGGEEFVIIFRELPLQETISIAERIRKEVEECEIQPTFTISCGIAPFYAGNRFETVIKQADDNLYKAKNTGRNKVCFQS